MAEKYPSDGRFALFESRLAAVEKQHQKVEAVLFGSSLEPEKQKYAIVPTLARVNTWLDILCMVWKAALAALGASGSLVVIGRTLGWW